MNDKSGTDITEAAVDQSMATLIFQHETVDTEEDHKTLLGRPLKRSLSLSSTSATQPTHNRSFPSEWYNVISCKLNKKVKKQVAAHLRILEEGVTAALAESTAIQQRSDSGIFRHKQNALPI